MLITVKQQLSDDEKRIVDIFSGIPQVGTIQAVKNWAGYWTVRVIPLQMSRVNMRQLYLEVVNKAVPKAIELSLISYEVSSVVKDSDCWADDTIIYHVNQTA